MTTARIEIPPKLIPVFSGEADVRGAYGGRGSAKTMTFALMTAVRAYMWAASGREGIILCARQFMNSLDESSMEEVKSAIRTVPWLNAFFEIGEKYIKTKDGRISYKFSGMDRNIDSIKSKAKILLCWVDEGEPVTDEGWRILIPTLRQEDSELWVTWNPKRKGSPTDVRFRQTKDDRYKVIQMNWRDNPKFPAILERARQRDLINNPDEYDHIWEGAYGNVAGSILGKLVSAAERSGRIHDGVVFDPEGAPVEVSGDIGFRDTASWWFWQRVPGGFNVINYEGQSGLDADEWIPVIRDALRDIGAAKRLGKIWLPHDAKAKTFQSRHTSMEKFIAGFGVDKISIVPQTRKSDQISAARATIPKCAFHEARCEQGLDGLRAWEYTYNEDLGVYSREPLHNWASHPSDAFAYGAQVMADFKEEKRPEDAKFKVQSKAGRIVTAPINTLWADKPQRTQRI